MGWASWTSVTFSQKEDHMFLQSKGRILTQFEENDALPVCNVFKRLLFLTLTNKMPPLPTPVQLKATVMVQNLRTDVGLIGG